MKRFLKQDRYELGDQERESLWHGIRRELKPGASRRTSWLPPLRPTLVAVTTVATLAALGVWWIDSNQTDKIRATNPGLLDGGPVEVTRLTVAEPEAPKASPAPAAGATLTGRILDPETGEGIPYATVMIRGTALSAAADSSGAFRFENLPAGQEITLVVSMLGYAPFERVLDVPEAGSFEVAFNLEAEIVETVEPFEVAGAEYKVEVKSAVTEHTVGSGTIKKNSLDSADEALSRGSGVPLRAGELIQSQAPSPQEKGRRQATGTNEAWSEGGSVTGGTRPPNDQQVELMYFEHTGVNPFVATEDDSLSTFAVDVDNASWTMARNYLMRGMLPPQDAVRVEEFVNAFDPGWPGHTDEVFRIHSDGAASRFGEGYNLLRIGVVAKSVDARNRKSANLIFVVDISGSMDREDRLGAVKQALRVLVDELGEGDRVGLVVYGARGEVRLEPTDASRREVILAAIDGLVTNGSTNVYEGLDLAYGMARKYYEPAKVNRLILCSDGVANNGASTEADMILSLVRRSSDEGITISTIGFGMGNYNDVMMEKLADNGDGNYYYVDRQEEAERIFRESLTGLLQTVAREVKVQVAFDPAVVTRWRLLGYENRDVADRDFRNDAVDAGEVGAGHRVTALYEVKLDPAAAGDETGADKLAGMVRLRYQRPAHDVTGAGQVEEIEEPLTLESLTGGFGAAPPRMRVQAVAAEFAEILRGSFWAKESRLADLVPVADSLAAALPGDPQVRELADLIRRAADLRREAEVNTDR